MKPLVVLFFGMLLWTQAAFASHADVFFFSRRGEPFQLVLNGRLINRYPTDQLHVPGITGGFHVAEIRFPDHFGVLVCRTRIQVTPGFKTDYMIQLVGRRPQIVVRKVCQYPLPVVARPLPGPSRFRADRHGRYEEDYQDRGPYRDRYDKDYRNNDPYEEHDEDHYERREDYYDSRDRDRVDGYRPVMAAAEVSRLVAALDARPFEDEKLALARQVLGQRMFYAGDLKRVLDGFSFDKDKLSLARQFYPHVYDPHNFYVVYQAFRFDLDRRELESYVSNLARQTPAW